MRTVGTKTQNAIDAQVFERSLRVSVWDEDDVEIPIPFDLVPDWPVVEGDLDTMVLRMTARVVITGETAGKLLRGRKIQAWEIFAAGEDLSLFRGFVADVRETLDYASGHKRDAVDLTCVGELSRKLEALLTRFEWRPKPMNPDAADPYDPIAGETIRLTGIVKTLRLTGTTPTPHTGTWTGMAINYPFFADATLRNWVRVYNSTGAEKPTAEYEIQQNTASGAVEIRFSVDPGDTFTIDIMVVDRWVILNRRKWNNGASPVAITSMVAPYYQMLHGVAGQSGSEHLNELGTTTIRADKPHTVSDFYVVNPEGLFKSIHDFVGTLPTSGSVKSDCWISVYSGGSEYRGTIADVNRNAASNEYGRVIITSAYPLRRLSDGAQPAIVGGETVENTTTTHYELLDPGVKQLFGRPGAVNYPTFRAQPIGGYFLLYLKAGIYKAVVPDYSTDDGTTAHAPVLDAYNWYVQASTDAIVIEPADLRPVNDVLEFAKQVLYSTGLSPTDIAAGATASGYALAPVTVTQKKALDLLQEALKASVPPTWRLRELEDGSITAGHIDQKATADLRLRGLRNLTPRELPLQVTRAIVMGKQFEVNRAAQFVAGMTGILTTQGAKIFQGIGKEATEGAVCTTSTPTVTFAIPAGEPGRFPPVSKVLTAARGNVAALLAGSAALVGPWRYAPTGVDPNDIGDVVQQTFEDVASISHPQDGAGGKHYLQCQFHAQNPEPGGVLMAGGTQHDTIDEIQVYHREGAYAEAFFTDQNGAGLSNAVNTTAGAVALPSSQYFSGGDFTLEAWIKASDWKASAILECRKSSNGERVVFGCSASSGRLYLEMVGANTTETFWSPDVMWLDVPMHVAVVVTVSPATVTFYRNGLQWSTESFVRPADIPGESGITRAEWMDGNSPVALENYPFDGWQGLFLLRNHVRVTFTCTAQQQIDKIRITTGDPTQLIAQHTTDTNSTFALATFKGAAQLIPMSTDPPNTDPNTIDGVPWDFGNPLTTLQVGTWKLDLYFAEYFDSHIAEDPPTLPVPAGTAIQVTLWGTNIGGPGVGSINLDLTAGSAGTAQGNYGGSQPVTVAEASTLPPSSTLNDSHIGFLNALDYFPGTIDDLRLWGVARTQAQIRAAMFSDLAGTETGLAGYWKFSEGTGTVAADATANARHGSLVGSGATWTTLGRRPWYATADQGAAAFGTSWNKPRSDLSMSMRYAPPAWLKRNMVDWHSGQHRTFVVQADGITQAQARKIAESYCDQAARTAEFWEAECSTDPRLQLGDTVEAVLDDDSKANYLVWKYRKDKHTTRLTLANYAR